MDITPDDEDEQVGRSWMPQDLGPVVAGILDGSLSRLTPTVGHLSDGGALFYRGKVNGVHGESGCGKSWTALLACAQEMALGNTVVYVDLEDDAQGIVRRLMDIGVAPEQIVERFVYVQPSESAEKAGQLHWAVMMRSPSLVVIDSTGEGLAMDKVNPNADEEVAGWFKRLPARIARAGPAVVVLDHAAKTAGDGLWPIGSQRKRASISGGQYLQQVMTGEEFSQGHAGSAVLKCAKDRHGTYKRGDKVARLAVTPDGDAVVLDLVAVADGDQRRATGGRLTWFMERISLAIEEADHPLTQNEIVTLIGRKKEHVVQAVHTLVTEGYVNTTPAPHGGRHHALVRPYRQTDDPPLGPSHVSSATGTGSGSLKEDPGPSPSTGSGTQSGPGGTQSRLQQLASQVGAHGRDK
jgi:hypothetical protein